MSCLDAIILLILKEVEGERTASSVFHLLKGKKSAQTIQDAHLYQVAKWFQTAPFLQMDEFDRRILRLLADGYLRGERQRLFVTEKGQACMQQCMERVNGFACLAGWQFADTAPAFFSRLQLLVQVASHLAYGDRAYYPVTRDEAVQEWAKRFVKKSGLKKSKLVYTLHAELQVVFAGQPEPPDCLLLRFSGHGQTGLTAAQAAEALSIEPEEYWYRFLNSLHAVVACVLSSQEKLPLLFALVSDLVVSVPLTASARKTASCLAQGMSVDEIVSARRLKRATVEDHIVELALNDPAFSIKPFITKEKEQAVVEAGKKAGTVRQLKPLKEQLPHVSYFEIRLVLAKESRRTL